MRRMPKCPRCATRKGKRYCPALRESICPQCCADERLKTIPCPRDCEYLAGELYQHKRRKERALSQGKAFVDLQSSLFQDEPVREFVFKLEADIFFFSRSNGPVSDSALADTLDALKNLSSKIFVPERSPHPIFGFLAERLGDSTRYPSGPGFGTEQKVKAMGKLASHVRSLAQGAQASAPTLKHHEMISSFFGALDFESDLDYSPDDPRGAEGSRAEKRSPSGLILP